MSNHLLVKSATRWKIFVGVVVVLTFLAPNARATSSCTPLHVEANGKNIPTPSVISLEEAKNGRPISVSVVNGCFQLPSSLKKAKRIDVRFQANGENIYLSGMEPSAFSESWSLLLNDAFSDEFLAMLKSSSAKEVCVLELDPGDGDGTFMAQKGCRSPAK